MSSKMVDGESEEESYHKEYILEEKERNATKKLYK